jgi:pilus assembly protein CpaE
VAASDPIRILLVEDVPQVVQYVRGLLATQSALTLLDVVKQGSKAVEVATELRPDVVVVDALLQGRVRGLQVIEHLREAGLEIPGIVLTVPAQPVEVDPAHGINGVLTLPFTGYEFSSQVQRVFRIHREQSQLGASRVISVFAPKGGVGKTTIAFNLAVAAAQAGSRTMLVDGSIQFGDLRALLRVPSDAPSLLDLPTDRITEGDLADVVWRDPAGIDILLAPRRIEEAEMVSVRDVDKILSLLRRVYDLVVIDTAAALSDVTLALLDQSDPIVEIVTFDSTTIHNTIAMADTFRAIGYPASRVHYLLNRADSDAGIDPAALVKALGRVPEHQVRSDGKTIATANNEGMPFVTSRPDSVASQDIRRVVLELLGPARVPAAARS